MGLLLAAALPAALAQHVAQAEELKSSIDRAGSAASQQIEQWLGAPAPKPVRKPRTKPAAGPRAAAAVPLPPPRPADERPDAEEQATAPADPIAKPGAKPGAKPTGKPAAPALIAARPAQPGGPVKEAVDEEPALAEAPGIPLPPQRPGRAAPPAPALAAPAPAAPTLATRVPLPPARPRLATVTPPAAGKAGQSPASEAAAEPETAEIEALDTDAADTEAANVPLPPPRPGARTQTAMLSPAAPEPAGSALAPPPGPLAGCPELTVGDLGTIAAAEVKTSPACRIERPVSLTGIKLKDGRLIPLEPAATLRCDMAAAVARWVREGVAPAVETLGSPLAKIQVADSYSCRPRNRVKGAKISEHGSGNAMDTRGYTLVDGRSVLVGGSGAQAMPLAFQEQLKASACADFTTILGPGSDGFHELHLHVDRAVRRNNMVLCRWATGTRPPGGKTESGKTETGTKEADKPGKTSAGDAKSPAPGPDKSSGTPSASSPSQETEPGDEEGTDAPESDAPAASAGAGRAGGGRK